MKNKLVHYSIAATVFLISLIQFLLTTQVSVSFWDPGELSAASYMLQVPHPPGGPLFLLLGRVFYMLPIPGNPGFRMNCLSVVASALAVLFFYLTAVKLIDNFKTKGKGYEDQFDRIVTYIAAALGALAFSFSDTFWFNGVESNYFAMSTLLFSSIVWTMMVWNEKADEPGSDRYLLLIAFLVGLSGGVHLMSVLTIVAVGLTVVLHRHVRDEEACKESGYVFLLNIGAILVAAALMWASQTSQQAPSPEEAKAFDHQFMLLMGVVTAIVIAVFRKKVWHTNSMYLAVAVSAVALFAAYPGVIKLLPKLLLTIAGDDDTRGMLVLVAVIAALGGGAYWTAKNKYPIIHTALLAVMLTIVGFTTYTMIVIRANTEVPMNENNPRNFSGLVSYLNREQYGDFPIFKRRWDTQPEKHAIFTKYSSDLAYWWEYQMNHMFQRYVAWNFIGRESHDQDAGVDIKQLFGIPFLVGLFGLYFHFRKDWKMASVWVLLFVFMGYLIAFYQNQQEPQPRDREYFYPGAYFIFAIWIGLGIRGIVDWIQEQKTVSWRKQAVMAFLAVVALVIPGRMLQANYAANDRSRDWVAWDYSYNMLQSCEKDAILFTNGDNDTFPLWYLQDVEGIRRDVRIVNLSLINTSWYIQEMKQKPYYAEARAVPISLSDREIANIQPVQFETQTLSLPVPRDVYAHYGVTDTAVTNKGKLDFTMKPTLQFGNISAIRVQDLLIQDIIFSNKWQSPVYFAVTCSPDSKIGLDDYLWFCGLAWRLEPRRITTQDDGLLPKILEQNVFNEPQGYSKGPQYGFKFRSISDPKVFLDENSARLTINYRSAFIRLALYYANTAHDDARGVAALDRMEHVVPRAKIPMGWELQSDVAMFYHKLGRDDKFKELSSEIEPVCVSLIEKGQANMSSYYNPYRVLIDIYDARKDDAKSLDLLNKLLVMYPNDPSLKQRINDVRARMGRHDAAPDTALKSIK